MRSMTGYGRGEKTASGIRVVVELHAVNRKHIDIAFSLPRALLPLEGRLREKIQSLVARGRINATITLLLGGEDAPTELINEELAGVYAAALRRLQGKLHLAGELTLDALLRAPGVLLTPGQEVDAEALWPTLELALQEALHALIAMRKAEGAALEADLRMRLEMLATGAASVRERAPFILAAYRTNLLERIRSAGVDLASDPERLLREVALFADRADITEELTRLESHFAQVQKLVHQNGPVGRTLDFLTQEIARELNTLGVKSNDIVISHWVVDAKTELEKCREQIQNIE